MPFEIRNWSSGSKLLILWCILLLILLVSSVVLTILFSTQDKETKEKFTETRTKQGKRLPRHVVPYNYNITLIPDLKSKEFNGFVTIHVKVITSIDVIVFHASKQLNISKVTINKQVVTIATFNNVTPDDNDVVTLHLPEVILPEYYEIHAEYCGCLMDNKSFGIFSRTLKSGRVMVFSNFEPTRARQAFPCFDEPDFKATFDITLVKPTSYIALSNMNVSSISHNKDTDTDSVTFARSVSMSTYLLCFVICDFDHAETVISAHGVGNDFVLGIYAQRDHMHLVNFAQKIGKRALEFYIQYYKVPFPLPKLDMIAVPSAQTTTESWGLITYIERDLLIDEAEDEARQKILVAGTIAHELAHMWFGNLVTMKWWDDLWLKEGFTKYIQYICLNNLEPSWNIMDMFLPEVIHFSLMEDAQKCSHPIVEDVDDFKYDVITYHKGASLVRMFEEFVGINKYHEGITDYLQKFKFENTVSQDLFNSIDPYFLKENPTLNLSYIMGTWTRQAGYPVLNVKPGDVPNTYIISQSRFLLDPEASESDCKFGNRWFIPVTYTTNQGPSQKIIWFPDTVDSVKITLDEGDDWVKLNNNQVGFYRVNYRVEAWNKLIEQLRSKSEVLTISDRAHLINDVFALASGGHVAYSVALDLLTYLPLEQQYLPWEVARFVFEDLNTRLLLSTGHAELCKFIQHLIKPLYNQQSWEFDYTITDILFHKNIFIYSTAFFLPEAMTKVRSIFLNWLNSYGSANIVKIESEMRSNVLYYGAKSATEEEWDKLWQIFLNSGNVQEETVLLHALTASTNTGLLRKLLNMAWDENHLARFSFTSVLNSIGNNPSGTAIIWDYVRANWQKLRERFTEAFPLEWVIQGVIKTCNTEVKLKEMEDFYEQYPSPRVGDAGRSSALETCKTNIKWTKHNAENVTKWLTDYLKHL